MKSNKYSEASMISSLSTSQASFFIHRPMFINHPLMEDAIKNNSYEIFQFLTKEDIDNLRLANKFFCNICDCHSLLGDSLNSLSKLFNMTINDNIEPIKKTSKLREKYNFNKPMEKYYKNTEQYNKRLQSGIRRKKE